VTIGFPRDRAAMPPPENRMKYLVTVVPGATLVTKCQ
jgi:hypothetical protein